MYTICLGCGHYHDYLEGGFLRDPETGKYYFVCLDCCDGENGTDAELLENIKTGRYRYGRRNNER